MNELKVSDAFVLVVFRFSATAGSAARYMSVASGAIAVNNAKTTMKRGDSPKEVLIDFEDISLWFFFLRDTRATAPAALQDMDAVAPPLGMSLRRLEAQLFYPSRIGCGFVSETFDIFSVREEEGLAEGTQKGRCYPRSYRGTRPRFASDTLMSLTDNTAPSRRLPCGCRSAPQH